IKQSDNSSLEMLIECYEKSGQASLANETKQKIMRAYPTLDLCAYYRFQEYTATKNQKYLQEIIKYNLNSYYYEYALENLGISAPINNYPIEKVGSEYKSLTLQIEALLSMKFYVGANMLLQNSGLESQNIFYFVYLQTQIYNAQEKYASSLNLAIKHFRTIYAYSNFVPLIFPNYYSQEVAAAAKKTDLPPSLIYAIIRQESSFNRGASSPASAYGLMQLTLPTAKGYDTGVTRDKLLTAGYNIDLGSQNLEKLMNRYNGNILKVAAAYNAGPGAVSRWEKENPTLRDSDIPYQETQNYVRKIINNYDKYNRLYYSDTNMVGKYLTLPPVVTSPLVEGSVGK
ncbi:MAG: lytic transglycosylase domain-containing protein, partial [Fusobacteria bacterium]|nr:lytic transglycosylase domain-containing protein [Fusobacteriota bacterium]